MEKTEECLPLSNGFGAVKTLFQEKCSVCLAGSWQRLFAKKRASSRDALSGHLPGLSS